MARCQKSAIIRKARFLHFFIFFINERFFGESRNIIGATPGRDEMIMINRSSKAGWGARCRPVVLSRLLWVCKCDVRCYQYPKIRDLSSLEDGTF